VLAAVMSNGVVFQEDWKKQEKEINRPILAKMIIGSMRR
jgi:hypothetical protein